MNIFAAWKTSSSRIPGLHEDARTAAVCHYSHSAIAGGQRANLAVGTPPVQAIVENVGDDQERPCLG